MSEANEISVASKLSDATAANSVYAATDPCAASGLSVAVGQMDVIAAYKFGLKNVVASLGTAFTEDHLGILKKYKHLKNLVFIFDSDEAGIKALYRSVMLARKNGFAASYVLLPEGMDLYDFAMKNKDALISEIRSRTKLSNMNE